jgi:phosphatidylglycerophosphate synthase
MLGGNAATAARVLTSFSAPIEKRCLLWIAPRLPRWVHSDHLTLLALSAMALAGLSFWLARWHPAALLLVVLALALNWFGDSLDGTLARVRSQQRPRYGFYVDHVLDAVGILFLLAGLALSGFMSPAVAMMLAVAYFLVSIEVYLATCALGSFRMSFWKLGPTELRILLAIGTIALLTHPTTTILGRSFRLFDLGGAVAIVALVGTFVVSVARNTTTLYRAEPRGG